MPDYSKMATQPFGNHKPVHIDDTSPHDESTSAFNGSSCLHLFGQKSSYEEVAKVQTPKSQNSSYLDASERQNLQVSASDNTCRNEYAYTNNGQKRKGGPHDSFEVNKGKKLKGNFKFLHKINV